MQPQKQLPPHYAVAGTLDLSRNRWALIGLTMGSIAAFFLFGWLALALLAALRPDLGSVSFQVGAGNLLPFLLGFVALLGMTVIVHEAIHGLFFWLFTRERPRFGFKGLYAYAAAPEWYLPRQQHLIVTLAPLVVITAIGLLWVWLAPVAVVIPLLLVVVLNAAGAVGDLVTAVWLLAQPATTLVRDSGDAITLYRPPPTLSSQ